MLRPRIIPCLLLDGEVLVKTVKFDAPRYVGDPINVVQIFNDFGVDEIFLLDIGASQTGASPNFDLIARIGCEAFVPLGYGGGVRTLEDATRILRSGVEKVVINSAASENPMLITELANRFGSQAIVASIDVKRQGKQYTAYSHHGTRQLPLAPTELARSLESAGAGEILLQSIDRDGGFTGYDLEIVRQVASGIRIPLVACGGAAHYNDLSRAVTEGKASGAAAGSLFVFQGKDLGVLVNYPSDEELKAMAFK